MTEPTRYEIATLEDFFTVPAEKRDAMLHDFHLWLAAQDFILAVTRDLIAEGKAQQVFKFIWIDDGAHNMTLTLKPLERPAPPVEAPRE